jgi:protein-L-isoaspartate O-methyltransferase
VSGHFDLYNHAYRGHDSDIYRQIRLATYGRDFGQTSWVSTEKSDAIPHLLDISAASEVLEIGFGSGRYALHLAEVCGCSITGLDVNTTGVATADKLVRQGGLQARSAFGSTTFPNGFLSWVIASTLPFPMIPSATFPTGYRFCGSCTECCVPAGAFYSVTHWSSQG